MDDISVRGAMLHRLLSNVKINQLIINSDGLTALQLAIIANQQRWHLIIYEKKGIKNEKIKNNLKSQE